VFALELSSRLINRNLFELFLQRRELVPIRHAAIKWAMDADSFVKTLQSAFQNDYASEAEANGEFPSVFRNSLLRDFHSRLPGLEHRVFSSHSDFVPAFHASIHSALNVDVHPLTSVTSQAVGDVPPDYASTFDSITNEPMGLRYQLSLETNRPIQLSPDSCSLATYIRFENVLKTEVSDLRENVTQERRNAIRQFFNL
jgi:hypothetical protein